MLSTIKYSPGHQKLMLLFPVPVVLCLLLLFHGLGGGKGSAASPGAPSAQGINTSLPAAKTDSSSKPPDKLQIYASATADSVRFREQQKQDPNIAGHPLAVDTGMHYARAYAPTMLAPLGQRWHTVDPAVDQPRPEINPAIDQRRLAADAKAEQLLAKVAQLQNTLDKSAAGNNRMSSSGLARTGEPLSANGTPLAGTTPPHWTSAPDPIPTPNPDPALTQLGVLSQAARESPTTTRDPEMERIDAMLDKLIRIQHPDLVVNEPQRNGPALKTFALEPQDQKEAVANLRGSTAAGEEEDVPTGFIEIGEEDKPDTTKQHSEPALKAVVDGDQTVSDGSTVALQLINTAVVNGVVVPLGQQLYGQASIAAQRLMVHISSLRIGDQVMPVSIQVYDLDGLAGIRVPGAVTREVSKESASEAISGLGLASMDPSLTGQAANAGLQLAKSLTSRKIKTVRVQLPAGYQVLLVNAKTK